MAAGSGVRNDLTTQWFYPSLTYTPLYCTLAADNLVVWPGGGGIGSGRVKLIGIQDS